MTGSFDFHISVSNLSVKSPFVLLTSSDGGEWPGSVSKTPMARSR
jgi:hypothetical protein